MSTMDMLVRRRLPGREIGQGISWNFTFETAEAMSLFHVSVYLAQHLWTKLGPPLDEERLLVPLGLSLSRRQRHLLQQHFAHSFLHWCRLVAVYGVSADPRLRDAVFPTWR